MEDYITYRVLLLSDSRGREIFSDILIDPEIKITQIVIPGATINCLAAEALECRLDEFELVIIAGGICNITGRNPSTRITFLKNSNQNLAAERFKLDLERASSDLAGKCKFAFAETYGIKFEVVNARITPPEHCSISACSFRSQEGRDLLPEELGPKRNPQLILNETILLSNAAIKKQNFDNGIKTIYLGRLVHRCRAGNGPPKPTQSASSRFEHKYEHLTDGIHPGTFLKGKIGDVLLKYIRAEFFSNI